MYIGYVRAGFVGATLVGIAFVLPSFVMVVLLGMLYVAFGGLPWMQAVFYGVGAAVIGIIVRSAYSLVKRTLKKRALLWGIFAAMCLVTAITEREIVWLFFLAGILAVLLLAPPAFLFRRPPDALPVLAFFVVQPLLAPALSEWAGIFLFFAKAGVFVFGSGLAIVPFLHGGVVQEMHWLTERQFLDAVAVAMITPGPVVITVGFIGYLVAGVPGSIAAAMGVFLPVWLVIVLLAPFYERLVRYASVNAFVQGVTAAATGAIAGAVLRPGPPGHHRPPDGAHRGSDPRPAPQVQGTGADHRRPRRRHRPVDLRHALE
jgi:chromate transporter